jgi:hypothetical protein
MIERRVKQKAGGGFWYSCDWLLRMEMKKEE